MSVFQHTLKDPDSLEQLGTVSTNTLTPIQQPTKMGFLRSADTYQQECLKCPEHCVFHSYAELLYAALLESDPEVSMFVPQPFLLRVKHRRYTPDFYVLRNKTVEIIELKPRGEFNDTTLMILQAFFNEYGMHFSVISNETTYLREQEARNWLSILRILLIGNKMQLSTEKEEYTLWTQCFDLEAPNIGGLINPYCRDSHYLWELALYRLLYQHRLKADLSNQPLNYDTEIKACT